MNRARLAVEFEAGILSAFSGINLCAFRDPYRPVERR